MLDSNLIRMLSSKDSERRKQAIMLLAKSGQRDALSYLQETAESDPNPQLQQLAQRGISYLQDHLEEDDEFDYDESLFEGIDIERESILPSDFDVPQVDQDKAQALVNKALDHDVRGNRQEAITLLKEAFKLNPLLMYNEYIRRVASNFTGRDAHEAIHALAPSTDVLRKRMRDRSELHPAQRILAALVILAATMTLLGVMLFPWVDISDVSFAGADITLGDIQTTTQTLIYQDDVAAVIREDIGRNRLNVLQKDAEQLVLRYEWMDAIKVFSNFSDVMRVIGARSFVNQLRGIQATIPTANIYIDGTTLQQEINQSIQVHTATTWDYALVFMPIMQFLAIITGLLTLVQPSIRGWLVATVVGLINLLLVIYFFNNVAILIPQGLQTTLTGAILVPQAMDIVQSGFWLTLAGSISITVLPIIAALFVPMKDDGK